MKLENASEEQEKNKVKPPNQHAPVVTSSKQSHEWGKKPVGNEIARGVYFDAGFIIVGDKL